MQAIIMAGGKGNRLRPLTDTVPKPMVPIIDKPVLEYTIRHLIRYGIKDMIITVGYKSDMIIDTFKKGDSFGANISYCIETEPLGTAGGVKNAGRNLDEDILIVSGDAVTNIDLFEMYTFHKKKNAIFTLACKELEDVKGMGVIKIDNSSKITEFMEKPEQTTEKLVNTGIYIMSPTVLKMIPDGFYDFGRDLLPRLTAGLYAYETKNFWSDIGTLTSYYTTNHFVAENPDMFGISI